MSPHGSNKFAQLMAESARTVAKADEAATEPWTGQVIAPERWSGRGIAEPESDPEPPSEPARAPYSFQHGGNFVLDVPSRPRAVWGRGDDVLVAEGEATILAGGQGLGKSTLAGQYALGRCGFPEYGELLGFPIAPGGGRVLYLAMDRPQQVARSLRRMVGEAWRGQLNDRLAVWIGPPPHDMAKDSYLLMAMCQDAGADTVIVDSLKDAAVGLTDDVVGAGWNRARQRAVAAGINVLELHHNRKIPRGDSGRYTIDDLYGSTWLAAGAGSVLLLTGAPGDPIVNAHHVKQPAGEVGPLRILHDHDAGRSEVWHATDLLAMVKLRGRMSAVEAATVLYDAEKPSPAEKEKARRKLDKMTTDGVLQVLDPGDKGAKRPRLWGAS